MTGSGGFTQTIDWLAFTLPKADVKDVITLIGGDWFQSETGFRGYPVAQLMTQGKTGAVSYTHLDVYKRQLAAVRQEAYRFIRPITPGCQYRLGFYGPQLIASEAMGALEP